MRFAFTEQQTDLRDAVRDLLAKECPPERVREAWASPSGRAGVWGALAEMGVIGMAAPEEAGGLDLDEVDLVLVLEESGRACLPEPIVETAAVAVPLLAAAGDARAAALASGDGSAAVQPPTDDFAVWADSASVVVLFEDGRVHAVDAADVRVEPRESVDGTRRLAWIDADLSDHTRVGDDAAARLAFDRGALGTAAQLLGLGAWMLDATVEHARHREQFGRPIGGFQAVKHHLANARLALEFAAPLVHRAAWSVAHDVPFRSVHVSMAKAQASDAAQRVARIALQCHGAIGYTTEYDLHLYMKRTWALARSWGDARWHRRRVAETVLDPGVDPLEV
jgi:alkylation response protein AidB-like acyl-CoA dehydrogenase